MNRKAFTIPEKAMFFIECSGAVIIFENGKIDVGILLPQKFFLDAGKQLMAVTLTDQMWQNIDRDDFAPAVKGVISGGADRRCAEDVFSVCHNISTV